ncbi:substrate-binding protein [Synergistales bacterium]|nr:substrate-binding protein [Synergistales bacterium]
MKRFMWVSLVLSLVLGMDMRGDISMSAWAAPAQKITFTYADINNEGTVQNMFANRWAKAVSDATDGNFTIEIYPGGILAKDDLDACLQGVMDMFPTSPGMLYDYSNRVSALEAPMVYKDLEHSLRVLDINSKVMTIINGDLIPHGFRILCAYNNGLRQIGAKKPIYQPSDLAGLKIRLPANLVYDTFFTAAGASPTTMSRADLPTALLTNVVDGMENSYHNIWGDQNHEVLTYVIEADYAPGINHVIINEKSYQSLSPEYQKILLEAMDEAAEWVTRYIVDDDINCKKLILDTGKVKIITEAEGLKIEEFRKLAAEVNKTLSEKYWGDTIELIRNQ